MRPLRVGVQLPEVEREVRWPELRDMARIAEEAGFDSVWYGDHLLYRGVDGTARGPWEAWSILAAIGAVTERVALGPLVAATAFHAPAMLAKKAATVDDISGGRLVLGVGAGWNEVEFQAFGFPYDRRVARFEEAFTIVRTLLREGEIDFRGRYYTLERAALVPRSPRPGGPPLMVGSTGERMLRITLPYVDAWNVWYSRYGNTPEDLAPVVERVGRIAADVGRHPGDVEATAAVLVQFPGGGGRSAGDAARNLEVVPVSGPPDEIAASLAAFAAVGAAEVQLVLDPITRETIEACGSVLAALDAG
jgi:alkanesulfonate monooxygenase SsuD/methylene tetrahydromethanopterin reductase-like flavin-dependent oxidoreductase (luciferase family)